MGHLEFPGTAASNLRDVELETTSKRIYCIPAPHRLEEGQLAKLDVLHSERESTVSHFMSS